MRFRKFILSNYRAISSPITIDVEKSPLIPVIGINECGKTTILQALFAFDSYNDSQNGSRHLQDTSNLYRTKNEPARIGAIIELTHADIRDALDTVVRDYVPPKSPVKLAPMVVQTTTGVQVPIPGAKQPAAQVPGDEKSNPLIAPAKRYKRLIKQKIGTDILITRNLDSRKYELDIEGLNDPELNHLMCLEIIRFLPHILYFDDFRDSIEAQIKIPLKNTAPTSDWLSVMERLFRKTDDNFSVYALHGLEERQRKSVLARVKKRLNETLTKEWATFRLDKKAALKISIDYLGPQKVDATDGGTLKLDVIETNEKSDEYYFHVRDRSKGFYWFFNFVMKLEFNPKILSEEKGGAIFLLDEPGSYLHASAQSKLCEKLKNLSSENKVIYCTHSHYLLDPDVIPINQVSIAQKNEEGISLTPVHAYRGSLGKHSAFQPIWDALQIKPFVLDLTQKNVILAEGIYDYYCLEMFKGHRAVTVLPAVGADSVKIFISMMLAWNANYRALWDNDEQGRKALADAEKFFGVVESANRFRLLPIESKSVKKRILQDLFDGADIRMLRESLKLPENAHFDSIILTLFYSAQRDEIVRKISSATKKQFDSVFELLAFDAPFCS